MKRTPVIVTSALAGGILLALGAPLAASAHVDVTAASTAAGSYSVLTFSVGHGCDGSPTESIAISLPASIVTATPTVNPNWTISEVTEPLDEPLAAADGDPITDRVSQIVYTAKTPLSAEQRDTFQIALALVGAEGDTLEFPTTQTCTVGETVWDGEEVPAVTLTAATTADGHDHAAADGMMTDDTATADVAAAPVDVLARVLGIGGLVLGAVGLVFGISSRRARA
jgi:periplasmic copper chaperone A